MAFISLGLPDGVLGVAWPSVRTTFDVPLNRLGLLLTMAMIGYVGSSFSAGWLVARMGVGRLLAWSSVLMVVSCLGYALAPAWPVMVAAALPAGLGAGAIDAGINAFAAARFPASMVNWLHASYGVGATLGPLLMTGTLAAGLAWRIGYAIIGMLLGGMTVCFFLTSRRWQISPRPGESGGLREPARLVDTLRRPHVWLDVTVFFVYTGLEVTVGQWTYTLLTEGRGVAPSLAGIVVGLYWAALTAGRVAAGAAVTRAPSTTVLRAGTAAAPLAAAIIWADAGTAATALGVMALGVALAPIYPVLIAETPRRLGAGHASHAIGFQVCAAYLGTAAVPGTAGVVASAAGVQSIAPFIVATALAMLLLREVARWADPGLDGLAAYRGSRSATAP